MTGASRILIVGGLLLGCLSGASARALVVAADPALKGPLEEFARRYPTSRGGTPLKFVWSSTCAGRAGEAVDVVISAGSRPAAGLATRAMRPRIFAKTQIAIITRADHPAVNGLTDLVEAEKILSTTAENPMTPLLRDLLDRASQAYGRGWLALVDDRMLPQATDSPSVVEAVASGAVDVGLAYGPNARGIAGVRTVPVAPGLNPTVNFNAVYLVKSSERGSAERFVDALLEPTFQQILARSGMGSPLVAPEELAVNYDGQALRLFVKNLRSMRQARVTADGEPFAGTDLRSLLKSATGNRVRIIGADGLTVDVSHASLTRLGAVLMPMGGGNLRAILPGQPRARWVRWVRRIEVF